MHTFLLSHIPLTLDEGQAHLDKTKMKSSIEFIIIPNQLLNIQIHANVKVFLMQSVNAVSKT